MQFTHEFWVGLGITIVFTLAALALGLRDMKQRTKKILEVICWTGAVGGLILIICNALNPTPQHEGTLVPANLGSHMLLVPTVTIGDSSGGLIWLTNKIPAQVLTMAQNQGIRFEPSDGQLLVTVKVLDKDGKFLGGVMRNHWTVPNVPQIADWNYTKDALEVIGPTNRVV
ncbi:MAG: hypothetical protein WCA59_21260, partial [Candidatus Binataceae bacterium]